MSRYNRVSPRFWPEAQANGWTDDMKTLALYLLTCEHRTTEGLFRLPIEYMAADLTGGDDLTADLASSWTVERVSQTVSKLLSDGFLEYDKTARVVFLPKALAHQATDNENQRKAVLKSIASLPDTPLIGHLVEAARAYDEPLHEALVERFGNRLETVTETVSKPPAPTPAPTPSSLRDSLSESRDPDRVDRRTATKALSAPGLSDWEDRATDLLDRSSFPNDLVQLAELLAAENKTGKTAISRVVRELYGPLVEMETEFSQEAMRHGLRAAITAQAPNANYVRKAAAKYKPLAVATNTAAGGDLSDYDTNFLTG